VRFGIRRSHFYSYGNSSKPTNRLEAKVTQPCGFLICHALFINANDDAINDVTVRELDKGAPFNYYGFALPTPYSYK